MTSVKSDGLYGGFTLGAGPILGEPGDQNIITQTQRAAANQALLEKNLALSSEVDEAITSRATDLAELVRIGAAGCEDIELYNDLAMQVWRSNVALYQSVISVASAPQSVPFPFQPPLFTSPDGVNVDPQCTEKGTDCAAALSVKSPCRGGQISPDMRIVTSGREDQVTLFENLQPSPGLEGLGALPAAAVAVFWGVVILISSGLVTFFVISALESLDGNAQRRIELDLSRLKLKIAREASKAVLNCTKQQIDAGVEPVLAMNLCAAEAERVFPDAELQGFSPDAGIFGGLSGFIKTSAVVVGGLWLIANRDRFFGSSRKKRRR